MVETTSPVHILWFEQSKSNQKFQLLHHRNFLFKDRLKRISVTSNAEQVRFALTADGENRSLIVHNVTQAKDKSRLQTHIQDLMTQTKQSNTTLIGRKPMLKNWSALNMTWTANDAHFQCNLSQNALQYAIVECTMQPKDPSYAKDPIAVVDSSASVSKSNEQPVEASGSEDTTQPTGPKDLSSYLHFSEVMQIPVKVAKFRGEWLELYNPTDAIIDLSTYSVHSNDDKGFSFTSEHTIQPKSTFYWQFEKAQLEMEDCPK